jgi:hypothetical protein
MRGREAWKKRKKIDCKQISIPIGAIIGTRDTNTERGFEPSLLLRANNFEKERWMSSPDS